MSFSVSSLPFSLAALPSPKSNLYAMNAHKQKQKKPKKNKNNTHTQALAVARSRSEGLASELEAAEEGGDAGGCGCGLYVLILIVCVHAWPRVSKQWWTLPPPTPHPPAHQPNRTHQILPSTHSALAGPRRRAGRGLVGVQPRRGAADAGAGGGI